MYLYIKYGDIVKRIADVTLHSFSVPGCGEAIEDRLDPALWFKVLVLESILVDCDKKNVFWNRDIPREDEDIHGYKEKQLTADLVLTFFQNKESLCEVGDSLRYDPTYDDLFETAFNILKGLADVEESRLHYGDLFKMFHMFLLPKIRFRKEDKRAIETVLEGIENHHCVVEDKIQKTLKAEKNTECSLDEQTKQLLRKLEDFSRPSYVASCDHKFLNVFLQRLEKFVSSSREDLTTYKQKIQPLRNSKNKKDKSKLRILRCERDWVNEDLKKALVIKAKVESHLRERRNHHAKHYKNEKVHYTSFEFQKAYVKTIRCLQISQEEIHKLIKTKVKLSAVREAVLLTLKEIDIDGHSYGFTRRKGSFATDSVITGLNHMPDEWITLPEKVKGLLHNPERDFQSRHAQFCETMQQKCQKLLNELKLPSHGKPHAGAFKYGTDSCYTSRWSSGNISNETCESICSEITNHISMFAEELSVELSKEGTELHKNFQNKVYICYGERVFMVLITKLSDLYEESYRVMTQDLAIWLETASLSDVYGGEIGILKKIKSSPLMPKVECHRKCLIPADCESKTVNDYESMKGLCVIINKQRACEERQLQSEDVLIDEVVSVEEENTCADTVRLGQDCLRKTKHAAKGRESAKKRQGIIGSMIYLHEPLKETDETSDKGSYIDMNVLNVSKLEEASVVPATEQLYKEFSDFESFVKAEDSACTFIGKLRILTDIVQYIESKITEIGKHVGDEMLVCADDLVDVIVLLLYKLESKLLLKLYAHINLVFHLCPTFMQGNAQTYALVTLTGAYHFLFEQAKYRSTRL